MHPSSIPWSRMFRGALHGLIFFWAALGAMLAFGIVRGWKLAREGFYKKTNLP